MSIPTSLLQEMIGDGRLIEIMPILGGHRDRLVFASPEVSEELDPDTANTVTAENAGQLRAWIDGFTNGRVVTVGSGKNRSVDLKILNPQREEVWELRKRESPSTRMFGRFAQRDIFVVTNICTVKDLFGVEWVTDGYIRWPIWRREIRRCKAVWRSLFANFPPVSGGNLGDYVSNARDERN